MVLITNSFNLCEFRTFQKGEEVKNKEYYLWNVEPNSSQNASEFKTKLIANLYKHNEALVVEYGNELYVADSFTRVEKLSGDIFCDVMVKDSQFTAPLTHEDVMYFKLSDKHLKRLTDGLFELYSELIQTGITGYNKNQGTKAVFNYDTLPLGYKSEQEFVNTINNRMKKFLTAPNGAYPLGKGYSLSEFGKVSSTVGNNSRDIRALIDDVTDFTAKAFQIPIALLKGEVQDTEKAIDQFLTFCIDPLAEMIMQEINRKRNGYKGFVEGTRLFIDTRNIEHINVIKKAVNIDKLIGSGAYCINDIRKLTKDTQLEGEFYNQHFITKNYTTIQEALLAEGSG